MKRTFFTILFSLFPSLALAATITFANLGVGSSPDRNDPADASSYTTSSWTPPTTGLIIVFMSVQDVAGSDTGAGTISGNSITWVQIERQVFSTNRSLTMFAAVATGSTTGITTLAFGANTMSHLTASFFHADGAVDISGGAAAAIVQHPKNTGSGVTSGTVTLAAAAHTDNRPVSGFVISAANEAMTPRTNWTEMEDFGGSTTTRRLETQVRSDAFETTASVTWTTSSSWAGIAAEIKSLQTVSRRPRNPIMF